VRLAALLVIATARAAAAAPQLVCTMDGTPLRASGRAPLDHPVACVIDGADARADAAEVAIVIERPFAIDPEIDPHPAARDGARWIASPFTAERCALTTFRGELRRGSQVVWAGELTVRPECKAPRLAAALTCGKITVIDPVIHDYGKPNPGDPPIPEPHDPTHFHVEVRCELVVTDPPAGSPLVAWFRRTPPGDPTQATASDTMASEGEDTEHVRASMSLPPDETPCPRVRVDAAITRDGGIVWIGRTSYQATCPRKRP
jgi:hypothetical protein